MSAAEFSRETRPSLLRRLRDRHDAQAWSVFVDVYTPLVYGYMRHKGLQDADAADLTQSVLWEVVRSIQTFEYQPERGRFRGWLGTLAARNLARFLSSNNRRPQANGVVDADMGIAAPAVDASWHEEFSIRLLQVALEQIQPHFESTTWRAFERVWLEAKSAADTAAELGVSLENVYVAKSRVLKCLEQQILYLAEDLPQFVPLGRQPRP